MIWWTFLACLPDPSTVVLSGQVLASQYAESGAADIHVAAMDTDLEMISETTTDQNGQFSIDVPASGVYHLHLSGTDMITTAFSGVVGQKDIELPEDSLFIRSEEEVAAIRSLHGNCPTSGVSGGIIEGVVEFPLTSDTTGEAIVAENAMVSASLNDAVPYTACVLDDDGESVEDGQQVGTTGRFAIFGVDPGVITIEIQQEIADKSLTNYGFALMPESGIAPVHPALIDLPQ